MTFPYISNRANQSKAMYRMKQETKKLHYKDRQLWNKNKAKHQNRRIEIRITEIKN
jgi:hypothetical protein